MENNEIEELLNLISDCAFIVRKALSSGYLESVYRNALVIELKSHGLKAETEVPIPVYYRGENVGDFRADIVVNDIVIIELKAVQSLSKIHEAQLVNYLTSTGKDYGILINFGGEKYERRFKYRVYKPHFNSF